MNPEIKQISYVILLNKDGFVKLHKCVYEGDEPPYAIMHVRRPERIFASYYNEPFNFRKTIQVSADEVQRKYGLLIRAHWTWLYEES